MRLVSGEYVSGEWEGEAPAKPTGPDSRLGRSLALPSPHHSPILFFPDNQDHKRARLVGASAALAPSRWSGLLLGRAQIDRMRFGIESHGPGARLRPHIRHDGKLVRSFLRDDSQGAVTVGAE